MGEHFDLYFAGWCNDDIMKIIIDNDYNQLLSIIMSPSFNASSIIF